MAYFEPFNVKLKPYCRNHALFYVGVFKEGKNLGQKNGGLRRGHVKILKRLSLSAEF